MKSYLQSEIKNISGFGGKKKEVFLKELVELKD